MPPEESASGARKRCVTTSGQPHPHPLQRTHLIWHYDGRGSAAVPEGCSRTTEGAQEIQVSPIGCLLPIADRYRKETYLFSSAALQLGPSPPPWLPPSGGCPAHPPPAKSSQAGTGGGGRCGGCREERKVCAHFFGAAGAVLLAAVLGQPEPSWPCQWLRYFFRREVFRTCSQ